MNPTAAAADDCGTTKVSIANNSCVCFRLRVAFDGWGTRYRRSHGAARRNACRTFDILGRSATAPSAQNLLDGRDAFKSKGNAAALVKLCPELLNVPRPHLADKTNKYMTLGRAGGACTGVRDRERERESEITHSPML